MKRMKRILTLCLVFCLILAMIPAVPAQALTLQEQSWLEYLRPDVPKLEGSYPAYLTVSMPDGTSVKLNGTCGVGGKLTDEELVDILRRSCSAVDSYKDPQDAVNDVVLVAAVKEKLKFTDEDMAQLKDNFLALSGFDKVADILNLTMPGVGGSDMASIAADIVQNGKPGLGFLNPIPDSIGGFAQGLIINGIFVSWEEFQRDKDKYKDIVNMSQANARLRAYYGRVDELVRDAMSEKGVWTISITDQQVVDTLYLSSPKYYAKNIWTADIELIKDDGSYGNANGTYIGNFKLSCEADLQDFDKNFHNILADYYNSMQDSPLGKGDGANWSAVSQTVLRPSEERMVLEGTDIAVTLSTSSGVQNTFFELPLDTTALNLTESVSVRDMITVVKGKTSDGGLNCTTTWTFIRDNETGTDYTQKDEIISGSALSAPIENSTPNNGTLINDIRPFIKLTLVVDMKG